MNLRFRRTAFSVGDDALFISLSSKFISPDYFEKDEDRQRVTDILPLVASPIVVYEESSAVTSHGEVNIRDLVDDGR
jgi:hypothetical protein